MLDDIKQSHAKIILDLNTDQFHRHEHINKLQSNIPWDCQSEKLCVPSLLVHNISGGLQGGGCDRKVHDLSVFSSLSNTGV